MPQDDDEDGGGIPARLDRLPWTPRHWVLVGALGAGWVLDGLQVTITGAIAPALQYTQTLALTPQEIGLSASAYVAGAVLGALVFGMLADRFGRRRIFYLTLGLSLLGMAASGLAIGFKSFAIARAVTGGGIGGEYAAINSAVDEWVPARLRGRINLAVNGSYWLGAALGAALSIVLLDTRWFPITIGWRIGCASGGVLGLGVLLVRRSVPESPRWLARNGQAAKAAALVREMEAAAERWTGHPLPPPSRSAAPIAASREGRGRVALLLGRYRRRSALALTLMTAQAFLFNAVFFTYGLVLARFYSVADRMTGHYLLAFCVSNLLGPLILGRFFDSFGRRRMLVVSFGAAGGLLLVVTLLFFFGLLSAWTQTLGWMVVFFFASAAASAAYLTTSEIFPLAMRGFALALFFALGTLIGGVAGPALYGRLIARGSLFALAEGYALAAVLMGLAALAAARLGVDAERKSLESVSE